MASFGQVSRQLVRQFSSSAARAKLVSAPIQLFGLEGRYAHALYSAASKQKKLEQVEKDLTGIKDYFAKNVKDRDFLLDPTLKRQQKIAAMDIVLKGQNADAITANFCAALIENGRLKRIDSVIGAFSKLMSAHRGEVQCQVTTAKPLDASATKELKAVLAGFMKKGEVLQLETKVDPSIIGGMVVNIGDRYVDMSMSSKIKQYTALIKEAV